MVKIATIEPISTCFSKRVLMVKDRVLLGDLTPAVTGIFDSLSLYIFF